jgi:hypothetical protein
MGKATDSSGIDMIPHEPTVPSSRHPPDEIVLDILRAALKLSDGAQGDRFMAQRIRLDKFSTLNKSMKELVPEAMYKANKVIVKAQTSIDVKKCRVVIAYPKVAHSNWVRELNFEAYLLFPPESKQIMKQVLWLEKLASGALGFERLDTPRSKLVAGRGSIGGYPPFAFLDAFITGLETVRPLEFKVKKLEVVLDGHFCPGAGCAVSNLYCAYNARLSALLMLKPST